MGITNEGGTVLEFQSECRSLVDRAAGLHAEIAAKDRELKELKRRLAEIAAFKEGSKTGHAYGLHWHATVSLKETIKWDQAALDGLRNSMGDAEFFKVFKFAYEPASKKALDGALEFGAHGAAIRGAFTAVPAAPQVAFKPMEEC